MQRILFYFQLFILLLYGQSCSHNVATNPAIENAAATFQQLLHESVYASYEQVPGVSMSIIAPTLNLHWTGASGFDSVVKDRKMGADQPFRIASITKTYVAAAILRLHEKQQLSIDDRIAPYLSEAHRQLLQDAGYPLDSISIRHCLNHTSGLFDYALGGSTYIDMILKNPQKRWSRSDQLRLAMETGKPTGAVGEKYSYGDTGYILLGEVIESMVDSSLAYGLRDLLHFDALNLRSTWLETLEAPPRGLPDFVHRYLKGNDATEWDASVDLYGGGGLVSTTDNLATFIHSLFNNQVFSEPATLDLMLEKVVYADAYNPEKNKRHEDYLQGIQVVKVYGEKAYLHNGIWGCVMLHIPAYHCSIAINVTKGNWNRLMKKVILVVKNLSEKAQKI